MLARKLKSSKSSKIAWRLAAVVASLFVLVAEGVALSALPLEKERKEKFHKG
jgi:hypothetical protein